LKTFPNFPNVPQWGLYRLGSSLDYSPKRGIEQDGFLPSYKYLIPFLASEKFEESTAKKSNKKGKQILNSTETNKKPSGYLGFEYECRDKGHRFILTPEIENVAKWLKIDNVNLLHTSNLPIFFACSCGAEEPAQLQRIFFVSSPNTSWILKPKIQFIPKSQNAEKKIVFDLGSEIEIGGDVYCVLCLPTFYLDQKQKNLNNSSYFGFLQGRCVVQITK